MKAFATESTVEVGSTFAEGEGILVGVGSPEGVMDGVGFGEDDRSVKVGKQVLYLRCCGILATATAVRLLGGMWAIVVLQAEKMDMRRMPVARTALRAGNLLEVKSMFGYICVLVGVESAERYHHNGSHVSNDTEKWS
ncbi:MAG: hypothetical protein ACP5OR_04405 [Candidatus Dormibacteria bacterium]